jgi:hypothetical protein
MIELKFDLPRFRQEMKTAFDELTDDELVSVIGDGIKEALDVRLREILTYEFSKEIKECIKRHREDLQGLEALKYREPREILRESLKTIVKKICHDAVNEALK